MKEELDLLIMYIKIHNLVEKVDSTPNSATYSEPFKIYYGCQKDFPEDLKCFYHFLSDQELERSKRFRKYSDERTYVIVHALVNKKIAELLNKDFTAITINYFNNQKPNIDGINIDFNLSHSSDYFAFAISIHENIFVGIDIEEIRENLEINPIINNYFHENEIRYLSNKNLNQVLKHQKFYEIWTRKEAFLKMLGIGLNDNLSALNMLLGERELTIPENNSFGNHYFSNTYVYTLNLRDKLALSLSINHPVSIILRPCKTSL